VMVTDFRVQVAVWTTLLVALVLHAILLFAELGVAHANLDVRRAAGLLTCGPLKARFWGGAVLLGIAAPIVLMLVGGSVPAVAALFALAGLWIYEDLWVKAGQSIPLS
jgi:hypothetical protein